MNAISQSDTHSKIKQRSGYELGQIAGLLKAGIESP